MRRLAIILALLPSTVLAEIVVPVRTIRARELLVAADFVARDATVPGAIDTVEDLIGQEARVALYPGRPVRPEDVGPPAVVDRNDLVTLVFRRGGLLIAAEGRALGRGAVGDRIRVMNLSSRTTLTGRIDQHGVVSVQ